MSKRNAAARILRRASWKAKKRNAPTGAPPGSMYVDPASPPTTIRVICGSDGQFSDRSNVSIPQLERLLHDSKLVWVDVQGLGSADVLRSISELIGIHPLAMEDILHLNQRAKVEQYGGGLFVIARMLDGPDAQDSEQIAFVLRPGVLVTFQQRPGDCWDSVRTRLRDGRGAIRSQGADYLMYLLLDAIIDSYFPFIDSISDRLDAIDERLTRDVDREAFEQLHTLRGQLLALRRVIRPHRDMFNTLIRDDHGLVAAETKIFLRDCYDHVIQIADTADTYNEMSNGIRDYYMTMVGHRLNEIMKVLTIMSSIFIPLSFVAGVYGMNFNTELSGNMPELNMPYAYPVVMTFMASVGFGLLFYFRRRGWI